MSSVNEKNSGKTEALNKESLNKENKFANVESLSKEVLNKESLNKESLKKEVLNTESLNKEPLSDQNSNETILDNARYLDSMEVRDYSDTLSLISAETSTEEFETVVEVYPVAKDSPSRFPFSFDWSVLFQPKLLHPRLERIIYWRNVFVSGAIYIVGLSLLLAINRFSILFVVPFLLLHIMLGSVACRMFKTVMRAVNNTSDEAKGPDQDQDHDQDHEQDQDWYEYEYLVLTLPRDKVQLVTSWTVEAINDLLGQLKDLILFKNAFDSIHFGLILISLAMLGKMMNGTTMLILIYIFVFTIPKLYELYKPSIDAKLDRMRIALTTMAAKFRAFTSSPPEN